MKTYRSVLRELMSILNDAVNLNELRDDHAAALARVNASVLIDLAKTTRDHGHRELVTKHNALAFLADETGDRRRDILSTETPPFQKGAYSSNYRDILSSFCTKSSCSFLFLLTNRQFIHCHFIIDNELKLVERVSFNETIYKADDPMMLGSIHLLNDLDRGLQSLTNYQ